MTRGQKNQAPGRAGQGPFTVLGLSPAPELTDDDVRAAWRRIAAATHPDRADGGDPARFAEAAAAYTTLRTASGRGEALADAAAAPAWRKGRAGAFRVTYKISRAWPRTGALFSGRWPGRPVLLGTRVRRGRPGRLVLLGTRIQRGRPVRLMLRVLVAAAASAAAIAVAGSRPAGPALVTGAVTWLLLTARGDLAPPR